MSRHVPGTFSFKRNVARIAWSGTACASLLLSGCMRDTTGPIEPAGRPAADNVTSTAAVPLGSLSPSPASGLSTRTSEESTTEWTNLGERITPEEFARVAALRVRVTGTVEIKNNPPFESYYCIEKKAIQWYFWTSSACHWSGLGSYGLRGTSMGPNGHLRIEFRVLKDDGTAESLGIVGPDSTGAHSLLGMRTPGQVQMRRYALRGVAAWTGHPTIPMYTFSDSRNITLEMVPNTEAELIVDCTGDLGKDKITRGQEITCIARKNPQDAPGELKIIGWSFEGKPRNDRDPVSVTWKGVMAKGGTVEVKGTIGGGAEQTARAAIQVDARNWGGTMPYPEGLPDASVIPEAFPKLPVREVSGKDEWQDGGLGLYRYGIDWRGHFAPIQSGPNAGWWYLKTPPTWMPPKVQLSPYLEPGDPFYEAQTGRRPGDKKPPRGYTGWCTKADMDRLRIEVLDHEGAVSGPRLSHHEFNVDYTARHDPGPDVERVTFYLVDSNASFRDVAEAEIGKAYLDQLEASNEAAVHAKDNLYTVPCKVHYP